MWSRSLEYAFRWLMLVIVAPIVALVLVGFDGLPGKWVYVFQAAFVGIGTIALVVLAIWASRRRKARRDGESSGP